MTPSAVLMEISLYLDHVRFLHSCPDVDPVWWIAAWLLVQFSPLPDNGIFFRITLYSFFQWWTSMLTIDHRRLYIYISIRSAYVWTVFYSSFPFCCPSSPEKFGFDFAALNNKHPYGTYIMLKLSFCEWTQYATLDLMVFFDQLQMYLSSRSIAFI